VTARLITTAALVGVAALAALVVPRTAEAEDVPILQRGDEGPAVAFWQRQVNEWLEAFRPQAQPLPTIGVYGPRTETLTRTIQREADITVDGIVGPETREARREMVGREATRTLAGNDAVTPEWPIPIPRWYWEWARWYMGHAEFRDEPFRSAETRPDAAPTRIPDWGWRRLSAQLGHGEEARAERFVRDRVQTIFGADSLEIGDTMRSERDDGWIFHYGSFERAEAGDGQWAAWLRMVRGRWVPWNVARLGGSGSLDPTWVPCDVRPAFSEPRC
jgi:hypothetical protein